MNDKFFKVELQNGVFISRWYQATGYKGEDYAILYPSKSRAKQALRATKKHLKTKFKQAKIKEVAL